MAGRHRIYSTVVTFATSGWRCLDSRGVTRLCGGFLFWGWGMGEWGGLIDRWSVIKEMFGYIETGHDWMWMKGPYHLKKSRHFLWCMLYFQYTLPKTHQFSGAVLVSRRIVFDVSCLCPNFGEKIWLADGSEGECRVVGYNVWQIPNICLS